MGHSTADLGVQGWFTLQQQLDHLVEVRLSTHTD